MSLGPEMVYVVQDTMEVGVRRQQVLRANLASVSRGQLAAALGALLTRGVPLKHVVRLVNEAEACKVRSSPLNERMRFLLGLPLPCSLSHQEWSVVIRMLTWSGAHVAAEPIAPQHHILERGMAQRVTETEWCRLESRVGRACERLSGGSSSSSSSSSCRSGPGASFI